MAAFVGSVLFSLDAAAVALTPVVLIAASRAGAKAEPLLFACIAVANTASMALPISNPTNVIVADRFRLEFVDYARTMVPAALAAALAVSLVLALRFRRELTGQLDVSYSPPGIENLASLATLLWLAAAREQSADVSPLRYLSIGVLTAPVGLAAALVTLELLR